MPGHSRSRGGTTAPEVPGILFLLLGVGAAVMLLAEAGTPKVALLLSVAVWDLAGVLLRLLSDREIRGQQLSVLGLISFARYWCRRRDKEV